LQSISASIEAVCRKTPQEVNPDCAAENFVKNCMSPEINWGWCRLTNTNQTDIQKRENPTRLKRLDLRRTVSGQISPNPPCAFALLKSDDRCRPGVTSATKMQDHVLARALCVREVIKIYYAAIRCAHKIHGQ
jgi:hypothetical protein